MLRIAYGDDSGKQSPLLVIGVVVATVPAWEQFSNEWDAQLKLAHIDCFKMVEAATWPVEKLRPFQQIVKDRVEYAVAYAIRRDDYRPAFEGQFTHILDKEIWAAHTGVIISTLYQETKRINREKIEFVFDVADKATERELQMQWERSRTNAGKYSIPLAARARMGNPPLFRSDMEILPLQAADMWAWYVRRSLEEEAGETATKKIPSLFPTGFPVSTYVSTSTAAQINERSQYVKRHTAHLSYENARAQSKRHKRFVQEEAKKKK